MAGIEGGNTSSYGTTRAYVEVARGIPTSLEETTRESWAISVQGVLLLPASEEGSLIEIPEICIPAYPLRTPHIPLHTRGPGRVPDEVDLRDQVRVDEASLRTQDIKGQSTGREV